MRKSKFFEGRVVIERPDGVLVPLTQDDEEIFSKPEFISRILSHKGRDGAFVMELYRAWMKYCLSIGRENWGSYGDFRTTIWDMKKRGQIERIPDSEKTKRELESKHTWTRAYYRLPRGRR